MNVEITPTHPVADGMHSAIVRATNPQTETQASQTTGSADACCGVNDRTLWVNPFGDVGQTLWVPEP